MPREAPNSSSIILSRTLRCLDRGSVAFAYKSKELDFTAENAAGPAPSSFNGTDALLTYGPIRKLYGGVPLAGTTPGLSLGVEYGRYTNRSTLFHGVQLYTSAATGLDEPSPSLELTDSEFITTASKQ